MRLYRSMKEAADGFPAVGSSSRLLGVRPGNAPTPDVLAVAPSDLVLPGQGGMSVAPDDPANLPRHLRPALAAWGAIRYGISRRMTWGRTSHSGKTGQPIVSSN